MIKSTIDKVFSIFHEHLAVTKIWERMCSGSFQWRIYEMINLEAGLAIFRCNFDKLLRRYITVEGDNDRRYGFIDMQLHSTDIGTVERWGF